MSSTAGGDAGPFRCSTAAAVRGEPMFATASRIDRWLLAEQPGPWGDETVPGRRMDPDALARVTALARECRARLLLVRRPPKTPRVAGRSVFLADSRPGHERTLSLVAADERELATLQPPSRDPRWAVEERPIYLVCTHGRHDPCCALLGRPVATALARREPTRTWECSHVGGDRFGANVVVLPSGLYLGRVGPGRVEDLVTAIDAGRIPLPLLRGRSSLSLPAQAAQHFARQSMGERPADRVDDLLPVAQERVGGDRWRVLLESPGGRVAVTVVRVLSPTPYQLTCHSVQAKHVPGFALVGIAPVDIAPVDIAPVGIDAPGAVPQRD